MVSPIAVMKTDPIFTTYSHYVCISLTSCIIKKLRNFFDIILSSLKTSTLANTILSITNLSFSNISRSTFWWVIPDSALFISSFLLFHHVVENNSTDKRSAWVFCKEVQLAGNVKNALFPCCLRKKVTSVFHFLFLHRKLSHWIVQWFFVCVISLAFNALSRCLYSSTMK